MTVWVFLSGFTLRRPIFSDGLRTAETQFAGKQAAAYIDRFAVGRFKTAFAPTAVKIAMTFGQADGKLPRAAIASAASFNGHFHRHTLERFTPQAGRARQRSQRPHAQRAYGQPEQGGFAPRG